MKMKEITAKLMALALCGCMTCSFAACGSSGNTSFKGEKSASSSQSQDKGDEKSDTTALSKTPEYEIQKGDFKSIMDIYAQVSDDKSGAIHEMIFRLLVIIHITQQVIERVQIQQHQKMIKI